MVLLTVVPLQGQCCR